LDKRVILFVGAFKKSVKGGATGGVQSACNLLVESSLKDEYNFILIDTSNDSVPPPPRWKKLHKLAYRNIQVYYHLLFSNIDTLIVFSSSGPSLYEKGQMVRFASFRKIKTIFAPRSGDMDIQFNSITWVKKYLPKVLKSSDYIICQSQYWSQFFNTIELSSKKYKIINNWLNVIPYNESKDYTDTSLNLVFMGWFDRTKGIFELLESVRIIVQEYKKPIHLHLCGGGNEEIEISKFIITHQLSNEITIHGWVHGDKKALIWIMADIFVMPTHFEGFPNAMIEAMNQNVPVIISDIPAIEGFVIDGYNGLICKREDTNSLSEKILQLITNPQLRSTIAKNAKQNLYQHNNIDIAVQKFKEIL
jgi:glycosyltransferase involved in cell wall biosynthesis